MPEQRSRRLLPLLSAMLLLSLPSSVLAAEQPLTAVVAAPPPKVSNDVVLQNTYAAFARIPNLSPQELEYGTSVIKGLDYNAQRAVRRFSALP
ncbi:hypothetical protein VU06_00580, partial [Desulfobulbus sp. F3]|nr:hypothetical protein [Desulfobulbus sp. F3]